MVVGGRGGGAQRSKNVYIHTTQRMYNNTFLHSLDHHLWHILRPLCTVQCPEAIESLVLLSSFSTHNLFTFHTPLNTFLFTPLFPFVVFTHLGSHLQPQSYIITVHTRKSQMTTNSPHKGPWSCTAHTRMIKTCNQLAISVRDNYGEREKKEKKEEKKTV